MYICPVCNKENITPICGDCGFDISCHYEAYDTLVPLKEAPPSVTRRKQKKESILEPGVFTCSKCKSTRFQILPEKQIIRCADCGTEAEIREISWKKTPNKRQTYPTVSLSANHVAAVRADGKVQALGQNDQGQCATSYWKNIVAVSCGEAHTAGLKADGTVVACGSNNQNQCEVSQWKNITSILAGRTYTLGLKEDGRVVASGWFGYYKDISKRVKDWKDIAALAGSDHYIMGLCSDGSVVTADYNEDERVWHDSGWTDITAIACCNSYMAALKKDGTVVATGTLNGINITSWKNITSIACASDHMAGLREDGTVVAVGDNEKGQCDVSNWKNIIAVTCREETTIGLRSDGSVVATGTSHFAEDTEILKGDFVDIFSISDRTNAAVAGIGSDGTLRFSRKIASYKYGYMGPNSISNVRIPEEIRNRIKRTETPDAVTASAFREFPFVAFRYDHAFPFAIAVKKDGTITYNENEYLRKKDTGKLADWKDMVAISRSDSHIVGLKSDGTVVACGDNDDGQCDVLQWKDIAAITTGYSDAHGSYTLGLRTNGTLAATSAMSCREEIQQWRDIVSVAMGDDHVVGLKADGTVVAAGNNEYGQCDTNTMLWQNINSIACGYQHTVGLRADGRVTATGYPFADSCEVCAPEWQDITAIACGFYHTVGLRANGTVIVAGTNDWGQCDTSSWKNIAMIACSDYATIGLKKDGTIITTGIQKEIGGYEELSGWHDIVAIECRNNRLIGLKADGSVWISGCSPILDVYIPDIYNR